ncbi:hypothetical protein FDENT_959 [Fusarium denticulatum]|uniref:Chromo domain-containing protein n=1 Tax=Fusarium denticulatum TaxID=48507 RepID=A0A8H5XJR7_9HYPO|nr:hypothetical protein FDENT_959 [Fusarium denticulatum]
MAFSSSLWGTYGVCDCFGREKSPFCSSLHYNKWIFSLFWCPNARSEHQKERNSSERWTCSTSHWQVCLCFTKQWVKRTMVYGFSIGESGILLGDVQIVEEHKHDLPDWRFTTGAWPLCCSLCIIPLLNPINGTEKAFDLPTNINSANIMASNSQNNRGQEIDYLIRHKVDRRNNTVEFLVQWTDDTPRSWEHEGFLQQIDHETLYAYWEERGGRDQVTRLEKFHVFKVNAKGWKKGDWAYNCQWVGCPPEQNTWEPEAKILSNAPAAVADWEAREAARLAKVAARNAENQ